MSTPAVFHVAELPSGDVTVLGGSEGRHAATVRRLRAGEELLLSDGRGGTALCRVAAVDKAALSLCVLERAYRDAPQPRVLLAQALVKGERGELAVELATEAGVDEIVPWRASRSVARWDEGPRGDKALARWRARAASAAKQARRCWVPVVREPVSTEALTECLRAAAAALALHESAAIGIAEHWLPTGGDIALVVGPEGGISEPELSAFVAAGATPVRLSPTVLRASSAGAVALGAIGVLTPRWSAGGDTIWREHHAARYPEE